MTLLPAEIEVDADRAANYAAWFAWLAEVEVEAKCRQQMKKILLGLVKMGALEEICQATAAYVDLHTAFGLARLAGVRRHLE